MGVADVVDVVNCVDIVGVDVDEDAEVDVNVVDLGVFMRVCSCLCAFERGFACLRMFLFTFQGQTLLLKK